MDKKDNTVVKIFLFLAVLLIISIIYRVCIMRYHEIKERGHLIELQDYALEMEIRRNMNYYGELWSGEIEDCYSTMEIIGEDIQSLEDLRHFPSLTRLYLRETSVTDLSPLESMKDLRLLIIDGGKLKDLESLSKVTTLGYIGLKNLPITSIQPLAEMKNLTRLSLSGLDLREISAWEGDTLTMLELRNLPLTTIDGFRSEKNIENIDIRNTKIKDVSALSHMLGLKYINITDSPIVNMPNLEHLTQLCEIEIRNTNIERLPALPNDLMELCLSGNLISDFSFIKPMDTLYTLEVSDIQKGSALAKLDFLKMCPKVSRLTLSNNHLQSLDGIKFLSRLVELNLSGNELENVRGIEIHENLKSLNLSYNPVNDLSGIEQLKHLKELNVSGIDLSALQTHKTLSLLKLKTLSASSCDLSNLNFLENSLEMQELHISYNRLRDLSVLAEMERLYDLDISYNSITDLTPLKELPIDNLDISGINLQIINPKLGIEVLKMSGFYTIVASNCNLENIDFINPGMYRINVSDNHIQDVSLLKEDFKYSEQIDVSGNPLTEQDLMNQLDVIEAYPGIYIRPSKGDLRYCQIKIHKDSEFLEDIRHYEP